MRLPHAILLLLLAPSTLAAQQPSTQKLKGVWEPVSYPADVYFNDVYFATPDVGWVAAGAHGKAGMILNTQDGGASWTAQLGDPESSDPAFHDLRFIDPRTGWVLQDGPAYKLLHTTDGQEWSQVGSLERHWGIPDYEFVSPRRGLYIDGNDNVSRIMRTLDGGRTWEEVFKCEATIQIEGLTKNVECALKTLHFPSSSVGYAMGGAHGAKRMLFVARTDDGGDTWKVSVVPDIGGDTEVYFDHEAFFTDEKTGVVSLSDGRIHRTADGGESWKGVVGTPGPAIRFADPVVGWSFSSYRTMSYTTDGGRRWTTRDIPFPAKITAFSLPRRDRGYVVGEHGMIYRYRVIGRADAAAAKAIPGPAMPLFDSPLDEQVSELDGMVDALEAAVTAAPEPTTGTATAPETDPEADAVPDEPEADAEYAETDTESELVEPAAEDMAGPSSAFTSSCCGKQLSRFQLILTALTGTIPQFLAGHKNTNLLVAGLQMLTDLPGKVNELNNALRSFRKAPDKAAAMTALGRVTATIAALNQSTAAAFQKQVPATAETDGETAAAADVEARQAEDPPGPRDEEMEMAPEEDAAASPADEVEGEATAEEAGEGEEAASENEGR